MEVKNWYQSKVVWVNVISALLMVFDLLVKQPFIPTSYLPYIAFAVGVLNVILRVWFTDSGISSSKAVAARAAR